MVWDAIRAARRQRIPSLLLIHNWDNLSSKGAFAVRPDWLGVWGDQAVEHAVRIHGFPRERVRKLGAPSLDPYFHHVPGSTESPFPFRYALFAGCYAPFDERSALIELDREIETRNLDLTIVYRPHPHRRPRKTPDLVEDGEFRHVVIDPQMREIYADSRAEYQLGARRAQPLLPPLDYYPALFEHAEFVICPLSTMIVEAAAFERRVLVVDYEHFEGIDRINGFHLARTSSDLPRLMVELERGEGHPQTPLREQIRWWLHHDERTYAERLADLVEEVGGEAVLTETPRAVHAAMATSSTQERSPT
jgi:hypothetical protein